MLKDSKIKDLAKLDDKTLLAMLVRMIRINRNKKEIKNKGK